MVRDKSQRLVGSERAREGGIDGIDISAIHEFLHSYELMQEKIDFICSNIVIYFVHAFAGMAMGCLGSCGSRLLKAILNIYFLFLFWFFHILYL